MSTDALPSESAPSAAVIWDWLTPTGVVLAAVVAAGFAYAQFLANPDHLWWSLLHDRNVHYLLGLNVALDIRNLDLVRLVVDLEDAKVWPPLHGILVGLVLAVFGPDQRLAILPSLVGWVGTALFGFLAARRAAGAYGNWAGLLAAVFILASPAHRAFATDTMLESLGACLTLMCLYYYLRAVQQPTPGSGRALALCLITLFFEKFNYWMIVVLALTVTELARAENRRWLWGTLISISWRDWVRSQLRSPLTYLLIAVLALVAWIAATGGVAIPVGSRTSSVRSIHNPLTVAYVLLLVQVSIWWWRGGRSWLAGQSLPLRQLAYWLCLPIAVWLLLPQRLGYFLWFLSPANASANDGLLFGCQFYLKRLVLDYHQHACLFGLTVALLVLAVAAHRRLPRGGTVILWMLLCGLALTINHPNRKSRYVHSWVAVGWVGAGLGLAQLLRLRQTAASGPARTWLAAGAVVGLAALQAPSLGKLPPPMDGGLALKRPSTLELTRCFLPELEQAGHVAILSNMPLRFFSAWTFRERFGLTKKLDTEVRGSSKPGVDRAALFQQWQHDTDCDTVVFIKVPKGSAFYDECGTAEAYEELPALMQKQSRFQLSRTWQLEQCGCQVSLWSRTGGP
jgi:hypothetical protein